MGIVRTIGRVVIKNLKERIEWEAERLSLLEKLMTVIELTKDVQNRNKELTRINDMLARELRAAARRFHDLDKQNSELSELACTVVHTEPFTAMGREAMPESWWKLYKVYHTGEDVSNCEVPNGEADANPVDGPIPE